MPLGRTEFVRVDIRTPSIAKIINAAEVDTVVHLNLVTMTLRGPDEGQGTQRHRHDAAAGRLPAVGGDAQGRGPVVGGRLRLVRARPGGLHRDRRAGAARRRPAMPRTRSRSRATSAASPAGVRTSPCPSCASPTSSGRSVDSPLSRYFHMPVVATVLGFDPRLQFVHEDDGVEVLRRMAVEDHPGTFNVAGDGVVLLSQALRRGGPADPAPARPRPADAGRPGPPVRRAEGLLSRAAPLADVRPGARHRPAGRELAWRPKYSSEEAFADFADAQGLGQGLPVGLLDRLTSAVGGRR